MKKVEEMCLLELESELLRRRNIARRYCKISRIACPCLILNSIAAVVVLNAFDHGPITTVLFALTFIGVLALLTFSNLNSYNHDMAKKVAERIAVFYIATALTAVLAKRISPDTEAAEPMSKV